LNNIELSIQLPPDIAQQVAHQWLAAAKSYEIDCAESYEAAALDLQAIKARLVELEEQRKSLTRPLDQAKAKIMDFFRPPKELLEEGERVLKGAMLAYSRAEERKRREHEAQLREEARRNRERLEAEARAAAANGAEDVAELKREQAENVITPILAPVTPKPKGIAIPETWRAELTDKKAALRAVVDGKAPDELGEVNMKVANRLAMSLKQAFAYPGLRAVPMKSVAARRR